MNPWIFRTLFGCAMLILVACGGGAPPAAPFTLEPSAKTLEVTPGGISSFAVKLNRTAGFSDTVNMTFEGLPEGITQRWSRDSENGDCSVQLSIDPETLEGDYSITLKGETAQALAASQRAGVRALATNTQTLTVSVRPSGGSGAQGFTLSFSPTFVGVQQTNTVSTIAIVTPVNGFSQDVAFSVSNLPANVSAVVEQGGPNNAFLQDKYRAFLRFTAGANSVPGDYTVSVRAQSANFGQTQPLQLKVFPKGDTTPTFDFFSDAVSLTLRQGTGAFAGFRIVRRNGFTAPITVEPQIAPFRGLSFTKVNTILGDNVVLLFSAAPNATITSGLFLPMLVKATGGGITKQLTLLLKVDPRPGGRDADFAGKVPNGFFINIGQALAAGSGQHFVAGKLATDDGFIKLKNDGTPDTSFGTSNGIALRPNLSSATAKFVADSTLFLPGTAFPVRAVGRLVPTDLANSGIDLAMLAFSADGKQNFTKSIEFSTGIQSFGTTDPVRAIGISEKTFATGTITPSGDLPRCFLALIQFDGQVPVKKEFRFNPLSTVSSECNTIATIPGITSRFYVGGSQTNLALVSAPVVAKFDLNGELDKNFAGDGVAKLEGLGTLNEVKAIAVQTNGKIVIGLDSQGAVARLNTDGKLDTTFGSGGIVKLNPANLSGSKTVDKVVIGANGAIFVLVKQGTDSNIAKLNSSGALQTDFGNNGFLDFGGSDILAQPGNLPVLLVLIGSDVVRFFQ